MTDLWITEPGGGDARKHLDTAAVVEHGLHVLRTVAETSRLWGNPRAAARLEQLARDAEVRLARLHELHRKGRAADGHLPHTARTSERVRVLVADDHELAREAIRSVLRRLSSFEIVGEAATGRDAVAQARRLRPELVLIDVRMPDMDGLAATRAIIDAVPETRVVILTTYDNPEYILEALRSGAAGYVLKGATKRELLATIDDVLAGGVHLQPATTGRLMRESEGASEQHLSQRERAVLRLLAQGRTNTAIGNELNLTVNTVKTHVRHILAKLEAPDRAAAVARAAALGVLERAPVVDG